jgi:hypothetical protein
MNRTAGGKMKWGREEEEGGFLSGKGGGPGC